MQTTSITITADAGDQVDLGGFGVAWKIEGGATGERFSVVHHPIAPRALVAPLHRHTREDEYSYVLEGTLGALLGDEVVTARPGTWVFKPREQWHTFWNDGDEPCHILEIIAPGGFEHYFDELGDIVGADGPPDLDAMMALNERYGLEMKPETVPEICAKYGLWHPMLEMTAA
jgi:mannose-6-phosphate isomerase-like protein (cupin superfamily)